MLFFVIQLKQAFERKFQIYKILSCSSRIKIWLFLITKALFKMSSYLRMVFVNECVYLLNCVRESDLRGRKGAPSPVPFYNYSVLASQNVMDDFRT